MRLTTVAHALLSLAAAWIVAKITRFFLSWRRRDKWMRTNVPLCAPHFSNAAEPACAVHVASMRASAHLMMKGSQHNLSVADEACRAPFAACRHHCSRVGCCRPLRTRDATAPCSSGQGSMVLCSATGSSGQRALGVCTSVSNAVCQLGHLAPNCALTWSMATSAAGSRTRRFLWNHTLVVSDPAIAAQALGPGAWKRHGLDKAQVVLYRSEAMCN
jgi:hypothetical protein